MISNAFSGNSSGIIQLGLLLLISTPIATVAFSPFAIQGDKLYVFRHVGRTGLSLREPVRLALLDAKGPTGTYSSEDGPLPW